MVGEVCGSFSGTRFAILQRGRPVVGKTAPGLGEFVGFFRDPCSPKARRAAFALIQQQLDDREGATDILLYRRILQLRRNALHRAVSEP